MVVVPYDREFIWLKLINLVLKISTDELMGLWLHYGGGCFRSGSLLREYSRRLFACFSEGLSIFQLYNRHNSFFFVYITRFVFTVVSIYLGVTQQKFVIFCDCCRFCFIILLKLISWFIQLQFKVQTCLLATSDKILLRLVFFVLYVLSTVSLY